jgi:4-amino-4-deoxy-L-arabinose transferase-like glycosyltransferase
MARESVLRISCLFIISLLVFTWGLASQEVIGFESRFYLFALEMWRHGPSWFPMTYHQPYPDYPATSTVLIYLSAKLLGGMSKLAAVLPTAIAASITLVMTYLIGALHHKRWGWFAVLCMLLTITFLKSARSLALDMYPVMITAICFYLVCTGRQVWMYVFFLLGFLFRGPIGLVMPTGVICIYYLLDKKPKQFFVTGFISFILLLLASAVLLALAYHVGGDTFVHDVIRMEGWGRMDSHYLPIYFYFINSLGSYALAYPLALLIILGVSYFAESTFMWQLIGWVLVIMLGMSIPGDKKVRYILPMVPAIALLSAALFAGSYQARYLVMLRRMLTRLAVYLPALLALGVELVFFYAKSHGLLVNVYYASVFSFLIFAQLINVWVCYRYIHVMDRIELWVFSMAAVCFMMTTIYVIEPLTLYIERARDLVVAVETERRQQQAVLVFYKEKPDGLPVKYLINMPHEDQPLFVDTPQQLAAFNQPAFFVTNAASFAALSKEILSTVTIIAADSLGHTPVVVFIKR